jgi:hypothetical protein
MKRVLFLAAALAGTAAAADLEPAACGVRQTLWIEHYSAQLFVPPGKTALAAVADPAQPKMLRLRILNPQLMPPDIPAKWRKALAPALEGPTLERLRAVYRALEEGDTVVVAYEPGTGLALRVNERTVASAAGHAAIDALLAAWASGAPLEQKLAGTVSRNPCA